MALVTWPMNWFSLRSRPFSKRCSFSVYCSDALYESILHFDVDWSLRMVHFSPDLKHSILCEYKPGDQDRTFAALARRHPPVSERTIASWYHKWDGTPESLQEAPRTGRPPTIDPTQRDRIIHQTIDRANRHHEAIHYPEVQDAIVQATHVVPASSTVRHWGEQLDARQKRTVSRTSDER